MVGIVGAVVLVLSLVFDDVLEGLVPEAGWISGPVLGAFAAAFGLAGWVTEATFDTPFVVSVVVAVAGGLALAAFTARVTLALMRSPTDATPTTVAAIGTEGRVVTPVRAGGLGEVVVHLGGQPVKLTATAQVDLAVNTPVTVVAAESPTKVVVEATETFWS